MNTLVIFLVDYEKRLPKDHNDIENTKSIDGGIKSHYYLVYRCSEGYIRRC